MLILLPPSETKSSGGEGSLALASLGFPGLASGRSAALDAVDRLVEAGQDTSTPAKARAAAANEAVRTAPVMRAIERYTGVLYEGLAYGTLDERERDWVGRHVAIGSALFGLVRAHDGIPEYKISHNTRVPATTLRAVWRAVSPLTIAAEPDLIVDMRSKAYAALLPVDGAVSFDVVDGSGRALAHWNKHAKGAFVRQLARAQAEPASVHDLIGSAAEAGLQLEFVEGTLLLTHDTATQ